MEFYAFDMLVSDGEDLRKLPLSMRKTNLSRLLARRVDGIHLAPFEQGEIGPDARARAVLAAQSGAASDGVRSYIADYLTRFRAPTGQMVVPMPAIIGSGARRG